MTEGRQKLDEFLARGIVPGELLFAKVWGSRSHNLDLPTSDWDFSGVFAHDTCKYLSYVPRPGVKQEDALPATVERDGQKHGVKPAGEADYAFHEIGKFAELLIKGNPGIVEMLFTKRDFIDSPAWRQLYAERKKFLSGRCVNQYLGYIDGQMTRFRKNAYLHTKSGEATEKWCYHMLRLAKDASRIAQGGEPEVWKDEGPERDIIMKVRRNELPNEETIALIDREVALIKGCSPWSLPEVGCVDTVSEWLLGFRLLSIPRERLWT